MHGTQKAARDMGQMFEVRETTSEQLRGRLMQRYLEAEHRGTVMHGSLGTRRMGRHYEHGAADPRTRITINLDHEYTK